MRQALRVPFRVVDAAGETTATGFVGGAPVQVPPGGYTVVIERADGDVSETVDLAPGDASVRAAAQRPQAAAATRLDFMAPLFSIEPDNR